MLSLFTALGVLRSQLCSYYLASTFLLSSSWTLIPCMFITLVFWQATSSAHHVFGVLKCVYRSEVCERVCVLQILLFVCFLKSGLLFLPCLLFLVNITHVPVCWWPIIFLYFLLKPTKNVTVLFATRKALRSKATNVNFLSSWRERNGCGTQCKLYFLNLYIVHEYLVEENVLTKHM